MRSVVFVAFGAILAAPSVARADVSAPVAPAAACATDDFAAALAKADKSVAAVRRMAGDFDRRAAAAPSDVCRVALFRLYWSFYNDVQSTLADRIAAAAPAAQAKLQRTLTPLGWSYHDSEAGAYITDGSSWLVQKVGPRLPDDWRDYLRLRMSDVAEGFSEDAGLLIGWTSLRQRIRRWEDFDRSHPQFELAEVIRDYLTIYLAALLTGMDNTPAFVGEPATLAPELRVEIEAYLADPKARRRGDVRGYYRLIKRAGFRHTGDTDVYLAEHGLDVSGEPPRY